MYQPQPFHLNRIYRNTIDSMAHWIITAGREYMQPMYDYFHRELLKRRFLMMDETPIQVLKEEGRRAQSKSYFWLIRTGEDGLNKSYDSIQLHFHQSRRKCQKVFGRDGTRALPHG